MPQMNMLAFRGPQRAEIDQQVYGNALLKNQVDRLPQQNKAQDLAIQSTEQAISFEQKANAAGIAANIFSAIEQNPASARQFVGSREFQDSMKFLGYDPAQFTVTDQDTPQSIQQAASTWRTAMVGPLQGAGGNAPARVDEYTFAQQNGYKGSFEDYLTQFYGRDVNEPASVKAARYYAGLDAQGKLDYAEANRVPQVQQIGGVPNQILPGGELRPLSTPEAEAAAKERQAQATARGTAAGEAAGGMKPVRLQAAVRRLDRVKEASEALTTGGPIIGGAVGITPKGQELNQANAQLITELTALTRIPGVGSQSDLEQRLAQLQLPTPEMYPSVRKKAIAELEAFMLDLEAAMGGVEAGAQGGMPDFSNMTDEQLQQIINGK